MKFNIENIPSQKGRIAIVTGANSGLGYETTRLLAKKDIEVVMACRNAKKAEKARNTILKEYPDARLVLMTVDLTRLSSVREFAKEFLNSYHKLDLLINNAGIMMPPYEKTEDGFESQFGVNYLSHFLLTGLLLKTLEATKDSRIVSLSSLAHTFGDIYFDDLQFEKHYNARRGYGQSKLACLMFAYELQRKLEKHKYQSISLAAHPGVSPTNLMKHLPLFIKILAFIFYPFIFQSPKKGALPTVRAALDPEVHGGSYYGPGGFREYKGPPVIVDSNANSMDTDKAIRLWEISEKLTGIRYSF